MELFIFLLIAVCIAIIVIIIYRKKKQAEFYERLAQMLINEVKGDIKKNGKDILLHFLPDGMGVSVEKLESEENPDEIL